MSLFIEGFFNMDITETIITFDGLVQLIRPHMTGNEAHDLRSDIFNVIIELIAEAQTEYPNLKDYVNVCRQEDSEESIEESTSQESNEDC